MKKEIKTVLIIAADRQARSSLTRLLTERFNLITTTSGKEGLQRLIQIADINLVFLEHELPDTSGLSILRSIRKIHHELPVAFMTKNSSKKLVSAVVECGIAAYMVKPLMDEDIERVVSKICANPHRQKSDVECAVDFIEEHLTENITVKDIAADCRVGYRQIARKFKESLGCTIHEYIRRRRVEKAKELLLEKHMLMYEIADSVGFSSSKTFCTAFKSLTNLTPRKFQSVMAQTTVSGFPLSSMVEN